MITIIPAHFACSGVSFIDDFDDDFDLLERILILCLILANTGDEHKNIEIKMTAENKNTLNFLTFFIV